jgi:uncharacterized membrane protein
MNKTPRQRLVGIDILRGLIIILMALDHTRDFWGNAGFSPTDLSQSDAAWFFTRWLTHFCAPLFVFLTGISIFLYAQKVACMAKVRNFLISRGLWLILLELTVVNISWQFAYNFVFIQVIWAIGCSMLIMAALIYLPKPWLLVLSLGVIALHNLFNDGQMIQLFGQSSWLWNVLHQQNGFNLFGSNAYVYVSYPLIPWFAVMSLGYLVGHWYAKPAQLRQRYLCLSGISLLLLFMLLRISGLYGDPALFQPNENMSLSLLSLLNTTKYPASLQFLLMTLGPGLLLLAWLDKLSPEGRIYPALHWLKIFGTVPMFFYLIHVPVINLGAHLYTFLRYGEAVNFFYGKSVWPVGYEPSLWLVYVAWISLIALLYYPSKLYSGVKSRSKNPLFSYL